MPEEAGAGDESAASAGKKRDLLWGTLTVFYSRTGANRPRCLWDTCISLAYRRVPRVAQDEGKLSASYGRLDTRLYIHVYMPESLASAVASLSLGATRAAKTKTVIFDEEEAESPRLHHLDDDVMRSVFMLLSVADSVRSEAVCSRFVRISKDVKTLTDRIEAMNEAFEAVLKPVLKPVLKREGRGTSNRQLMTMVDPFLFPTYSGNLLIQAFDCILIAASEEVTVSSLTSCVVSTLRRVWPFLVKLGKADVLCAPRDSREHAANPRLHHARAFTPHHAHAFAHHRTVSRRLSATNVHPVEIQVGVLRVLHAFALEHGWMSSDMASRGNVVESMHDLIFDAIHGAQLDLCKKHLVPIVEAMYFDCNLLSDAALDQADEFFRWALLADAHSTNKDIDVVRTQSGSSWLDSMKVLKRNGGDIVEGIMELMSEF